MFSNLSITTKAFLVASLFGFSMTATTVALGDLPSPLSNFAAVSALPASACFLPDDLVRTETEKKSLELSKVTLAAELKSAEKAKKDLNAILTASTTALNTLKRVVPSQTTLNSAQKKLTDLQKQIDLLNAKTELTSTELKKRDSFLIQLKDAQINLDRLNAIGPRYYLMLKEYANRKVELENLISIQEVKISEIKAKQKNNVSDLAQIAKNITAIKSKKCNTTCMTKVESDTLKSFTQQTKGYPSKIKRLNEELSIAKTNLPKAEAEVKTAAAKVKLATPAAIEVAKKKYESLKDSHEKSINSPVNSAAYANRTNLYNQRNAAQANYIDLLNAEMVYKNKLNWVVNLKKIITEHPIEIKKLEADLKTATTELPKLSLKSTEAKGAVCAASFTGTTDMSGTDNSNATGVGSSQTGTGNSTGQTGTGQAGAGTGSGQTGTGSNTGSGSTGSTLTDAQRAAISRIQQDIDDELAADCESRYGDTPDCGDGVCINHMICVAESSQGRCDEQLNATQNQVDELDKQMQEYERFITQLQNNINWYKAQDPVDEAAVTRFISEIGMVCITRANIDDEIRRVVNGYNASCPQHPVSLTPITVNIPGCQPRSF